MNREGLHSHSQLGKAILFLLTHVGISPGVLQCLRLLNRVGFSREDGQSGSEPEV